MSSNEIGTVCFIVKFGDPISPYSFEPYRKKAKKVWRVPWKKEASSVLV